MHKGRAAQFNRFTAMYGRNFKPKFFTDITMLVKLFVAQILESYVVSLVML